MKRRAVIVLLVLFGSTAWAGEWSVEGGCLVLGGTLSAERLVIGPSAECAGSGEVVGDVTIEGRLSPGGSGVGLCRVLGSVSFLPDSRFDCDALTSDDLDELSVSGRVQGTTMVAVRPEAGAIPVRHVVVRGNASSDYANFQPSDAYTWRLETTGSLELAVTHLRGDSDADGLPDWWEMTHFANSRTAALPEGDPDGDRVPNREEYVANTDPGDAASFLRWTAIRPAGSDRAVLTWATAPGRRYTLLATTNLMGGAWATSAVFADYPQPAMTWSSPFAPDRLRFFFIQAEENVP